MSFLRDKIALLDSLSRPRRRRRLQARQDRHDDARRLGRLRRRVREVRGPGIHVERRRSSRANRSAWKISPTVALTQKATGLWKTNDTGDAYYHFEAGLTTSLSKLLELKLAYLLDHKTRPAIPTLDKTDTALIVAVVAKF